MLIFISKIFDTINSVRNTLYPPAKSFVVRGRKTSSQQKALEELWSLYGIDVVPGHLDIEAVFGRQAPCVLEIGFGNGENLCHLAESFPEQNIIGIDVHPAGVGRVLGHVHAKGLQNVRVIQHDAIEVCHTMFPAEVFDEILIYFSDPWPKKRQEHRRLIQTVFADVLTRLLRINGSLRLATDWESYAKHMLRVLDACSGLTNVAGAGNVAPRATTRPVTKFEQRGIKLGHTIYDLHYLRTENVDNLRAR